MMVAARPSGAAPIVFIMVVDFAADTPALLTRRCGVGATIMDIMIAPSMA
jgi:hypothetical protein